MNREITWRTYLDEIVRHKPAAEKKRLYEFVGVTRTAFQRWRSGENTPDAAHIPLLLNALPEEERERLQLLMMDDLRVRALLPSEEVLIGNRTAEKIPAEVYEEIFRLGRDTPDHFWLLYGSLLFHALSQIETHPKQTGIEISVARCMPPRSDGKIHSLREYIGRGTFPWRGDLHAKEYFLGAESLAGYAVMMRHGVMVPDLSSNENLVPIHWMDHEMSSAAYPILHSGWIAGALLVSCSIPEFFTQKKLTLIEKYADLFRLAFSDYEFYPASAFDLALMPSWKVQKQFFCTFRQRVNEEYQRSLRQERPHQDLAQIEAHVREVLEGELIDLARQSNGETSVER